MKVMKSLHRGVLLAVLLSTMACGGDASSDLAPEASAPLGLEVHEAKAHLLPGGHSALYFTVASGAEDRLLRVETTAAAAAEMHETVEEDGMMRMVAHPDGFVVPAGGKLVFEPGGKHVMLLGFEAEEEAESIGVTLHFERGGTVAVDAKVITLAGADTTSSPASSTGGEHHHHGESQGDSHVESAAGEEGHHD